MEQLKRGHKIYLDRDNLVESEVNTYLECRDGIVEYIEYIDESGYGSRVRLFLCRDTKHEDVSIIRQTYNNILNGWREQSLSFDSDSFEILENLLKGKGQTLRNYNHERR